MVTMTTGSANFVFRPQRFTLELSAPTIATNKPAAGTPGRHAILPSPPRPPRPFAPELFVLYTVPCPTGHRVVASLPAPFIAVHLFLSCWLAKTFAIKTHRPSVCPLMTTCFPSNCSNIIFDSDSDEFLCVCVCARVISQNTHKRRQTWYNGDPILQHGELVEVNAYIFFPHKNNTRYCIRFFFF